MKHTLVALTLTAVLASPAWSAERQYLCTSEHMVGLRGQGHDGAADGSLPTAGQILQEGKVLHKEVHLWRDDFWYNEKSVKMFGHYKTDVGLMVYHVMYEYDYYSCWVSGSEYLAGLKNVTCTKLTEEETYEYED